MKKIKKWLKENKGLSIILILTLVLVIFMLVIFIQMLVGGSSNKYGHRLDGIEDVRIDNDVYDGIKEELTETEHVGSTTIRLQGKTVYTTIDLKADTSVAKAKELAAATLDNYTKEQLSYYDFSFFLRWKGEESDKVITGNKHHNLESISWIKGE